MAPRVGLEPTTYRLTAECSTIELPRNVHTFLIYIFNYRTFCKVVRRCSTLPSRHQLSTIDAKRLNFCVRYGYRCIPFAIVALLFIYKSLFNHTVIYISGQAFDLLVSVNLKCCHSYISDLSTMFSTWNLSSSLTKKSNLEEGFVLRCLQHLSRPDVAIELCSWRNNSYTSGLSIPVLSY